jgi:hypothetical protein
MSLNSTLELAIVRHLKSIDWTPNVCISLFSRYIAYSNEDGGLCLCRVNSSGGQGETDKIEVDV